MTNDLKVYDFEFSCCHRTIVYRTKKNMKCPVRVKIDLTKKRHNLLVSANKYISNIDSVKFCYADINCRLKIKWEAESINAMTRFSISWLS